MRFSIADQGIAIGVAARAGAGREIDHDARGRGRIGRGIEAVAAVERVGAAEPAERIVAVAAAQDIGCGRADQGIVEDGTGDVLDAERTSPAASPPAPGPGIEIDGHRATEAIYIRRSCRCQPRRRAIDARIAEQRVVAVLAEQLIVVAARRSACRCRLARAAGRPRRRRRGDRRRRPTRPLGSPQSRRTARHRRRGPPEHRRRLRRRTRWRRRHPG